MEYILGIDIGTGSTKAVAVGKDHIAFESSQYFYPTVSNAPGYSEQDPELIWKAFQDSIKMIAGRLGGSPVAVSLSSAMHSVIAVDELGNALAPMMTWADNRGAGIAERLLSTSMGPELYEITGTPVHSMSPLCKIIWIKENEPELFEKTYKFISIKEYIWHKLFDSFEVDYAIGSCTGLMDVKNLVWSEEALAAAGISIEQLSELVNTDFLRTGFKSLDFLAEATSFVIGASDGCLANLGTGAIQPGIGALTIGTSGALRVASKQSVLSKNAMTFSYRLDEKIFINGGPVSNGGIALKWHLKNVLGKKELNGDDYEAELGKIEGLDADGLIFLPYLQGERAPIWDSKSCGTFFGMGLNHGPAHFTRAVVEGICFALNDVLLALEASGQRIDQLNVSGGFVSSGVWLQILADVTGKRLVLVATEDASAIGAAYLAEKALGWFDGGYPVRDLKGVVSIEPDVDRYKKYEVYFGLYKRLYLNLKGLMGELHGLKK